MMNQWVSYVDLKCFFFPFSFFGRGEKTMKSPPPTRTERVLVDRALPGMAHDSFIYQIYGVELHIERRYLMRH